jgi:hypothetical protein
MRRLVRKVSHELEARKNYNSGNARNSGARKNNNIK